MAKRTLMAFLMIGAVLTAVPLSAQEKMKAAPAIDSSLLQSGSLQRDECYRWGWRGYGKYKNCSCVKCSWKLTPSPHKLCWKVC